MKRTVFSLLLVMVVVLSTATIVERIYGTTTAQQMIYHSWAFVALWLAIAFIGGLYCLRIKLYRRLPTMALHVSLLLILAGAATTWLTSSGGTMRLAQGEHASSYTDNNGVERKLPFSVTLRGFNVVNYPGTQSPADFVSNLLFDDGDDQPEAATVRMNHIASHRHYRFYQMGYDTQQGHTVLLVTHDPWGIAVTYVGYAMLALSFLLVLGCQRGRFRALLRHPALRNTMVLALVISASASAHADGAMPPTVSPQVAECLGDLYVHYNGRIAPVQTLAREFTTKLYGKASYRGLSAEQVLAGWIFYFDQWKTEPMIKVKSKHARLLLGTESRYVTMDNFVGDDGSYQLDSVLARIHAGENVTDARGIRETHEKYELGFSVATGQCLTIFPVSSAGDITWFEPASRHLPAELPEEKWIFLRRGMDYLSEMVIMHDDEGACRFLKKLKEYQVKECGSALPSQLQFQAEKVYNNINSSRWLAMVLVAVGILLMLKSARRMALGKQLPRWAIIAGIMLTWGTIIYLIVCVALRWIVTGHVPLSNGFETMQMMSLSSALLTLWLQRRHSFVLAPGLLVTGLSLLVSMLGESNPAITPLMPVLHSPWLSIHVATIMVAYSLLALMMLNSVMALALRRQSAAFVRLYVLNQVLLYPAVALLAAGIFIGAVWANVSWGTYWSWDPKEVWALITLIIYALPLHSQSIRRFSRPTFFHVYVALAFASVLVTYFGVNFFLGGMHSYA